MHLLQGARVISLWSRHRQEKDAKFGFVNFRCERGALRPHGEGNGSHRQSCVKILRGG